MALLEEVYHGLGFEVSYVQAMLCDTQLLLLPAIDQDIELLAPSPAQCLPAGHHEDNGLNL